MSASLKMGGVPKPGYEQKLARLPWQVALEGVSGRADKTAVSQKWLFLWLGFTADEDGSSGPDLLRSLGH
jgi:hypothetical protein